MAIPRLGGGGGGGALWDVTVPIVGTPLPYIDTAIDMTDYRYESLYFEYCCMSDPLVAASTNTLVVQFNNDSTAADYNYAQWSSTISAASDFVKPGGTTAGAIFGYLFADGSATFPVCYGNGYIRLSTTGTAARMLDVTSMERAPATSVNMRDSTLYLLAGAITTLRWGALVGGVFGISNVWGAGSYLRYRLLGTTPF